MTEVDAQPRPADAAAGTVASDRPVRTLPVGGMSRRGFLRGSLAAAAGAAVVGGVYSWRIEPTWLRVRSLALPVAGLPAPFEGFVVAHLSDLHHSDVVPTDYLRDTIALANSFKPDLIALTGDYITRGDEWVEGAAEIAAGLKAPAGVMAVLGNHDFEGHSTFSGNWDHVVAGHMSEAFERGGIQMLRDRATEIIRGGARLQVVGVDDYWARKAPLEHVTAKLRTDRPTIALSHNPDTIESFVAAGADLVLAGHTHGGQVNIPFYGAPYLPMRNKSLVYGLYEFGRTRLYVNPGIGFLARLRFNARPEITLMTLARA